MFQNIVRYHFHEDPKYYQDEYFDGMEEALKEWMKYLRNIKLAI